MARKVKPEALSNGLVWLDRQQKSLKPIDMDRLEEQGLEIDKELEALAYVHTQHDNRIEDLAAEIKELQSQKRFLESEQAKITEHSIDRMNDADESNLQTPTFSLTVKNNPPSVEVTEEDMIAPKFKKTKMVTTVSKTDILRYYRETGEVPTGVNIITTRQNLTIKS